MVKFDQDNFHLGKIEKEDLDKNVKNNMEEDLPQFGSSNKKIINTNRYDSQSKDRLKSDKGKNSKSHSIYELNQDLSVHSDDNHGRKPVAIQNPNNTMTKNESQNEDSLFKGILNS